MQQNYFQNLLKGFLFLLFTLAFAEGNAQTNIVISLSNASNVTPKIMEFDVWIKNQGTTAEKLSGYSFGISHSNSLPSLSNGGMLTFSFLVGSRDPIFNSLDPNPYIVYANKQFKLKTYNVNVSNAVNLIQGMSYKLGRFRIKNTVNFATNYIPNLYFNQAPAPTQMKCIATAFCNGASTLSSYSVPNGLNLTMNTPGFALNPPVPPTLTVIENQPISCFGNNDGSAEALPVGDAPFTFNVDGGIFNNTTGMFFGLTPGTHTICAKDVNGLSACATISFIEPDPLGMTFTIDSFVSCQGNDGAITANITGGTNLLQGYLTIWTNTANPTVILNNQLSNNFALNLEGLPVGFYNVAIEDDRGCFFNQTGYLPAAPPIVVNATFPAIVCNGGSTTITPSATGGVPYTPLTYNINGVAVVPTYPAGTYTITATDAKGCTGTTSITITQPAPLTTSVNVTACNNYTWPVTGLTYNTSGSYTGTQLAPNGCSETITLILTINSITTNGSSTVSACNTYTWSVNGLTYTTSGVYTHTTANGSGCINIATLTLTINNNTTNGNANVTACNNYVWNGTTYTASGTYTYTSLNSTGCLNTATLVLTINQNSNNGSLTITACDLYTWNGVTYVNSGVYTVTSLNASGCINTATLTLTINKNPTTNGTIGFNESACGPSFDPAPMMTVIPPTGGSGPLEYLWLSSTTGGATFTILYAATNATYDPPAITQTTWYRRCARVAGCSAYSSESNWVMKQVLTCKTDAGNNQTMINTDKQNEMIVNLSIYPNPVSLSQQAMNLQYSLKRQGLVNVAVYSIEGKLISKQQFNSVEGSNLHTFQIPALSLGIYNMVVTTENEKKTIKFIVR